MTKELTERKVRPRYFSPELSDRDQALQERLITHLRSRSPKKTKLDIADKLSVTPAKVDQLLTHLREEGIYQPVLEQRSDGFKYVLSDWAGKSHEFEMPDEMFPDGRVRFGAISNTELCNVHHRDDALHAFYKICEREGVNVVLHCGDIIAGEPNKKNREEIFIQGPENQTAYFVKNFPKVDGIHTYFITAKDCEGTFMKRHKMMIGQYMQKMAEYEGRDDLHYLGHMEQDVLMNVPILGEDGKPEGAKQARVRMGHLSGKVPQGKSYPSQKLIESIQGGKKPHVALLGHLYSLETLFEREVWTVQVGGFKDQSPSMRSDRQSTTVGGYICELFVPGPGEDVAYDQDFGFIGETINFFNREYYQTPRRSRRSKRRKNR